jgi:hypothetical protein
MANLLQQILETTLFPKHKPGGLALLADFNIEQTSATAVHTIPGELFPEHCETHILPGDETFIDALKGVLLDANPKQLFIVPPLAGYRHLSDELHQQFRRMNLEEIVLQTAVEILPSGSLVGAVMPMTFFVRMENRQVRERIAQLARTVTIITHDFALSELGFIGSAPGIQMQTLILEVGEPEAPFARFFKCPEPDDKRPSKAIIGDLKRLLKKGGGRTQHGYILRDEIPADVSWTYEANDPALIDERENQIADMEQRYGAIRPLSDLADVLVNAGVMRNRDKFLDGSKQRGVPLIEGRDILPSHTLAYEDTQHRISEDHLSKQHYLQEGDICVRTIVGLDQNLIAVKVEEKMLPLAAKNSVIVIRLKHDSEVEADFLLDYLRSDKAMRLLAAQATSLGAHIRLAASSLRELPVPVMDETLTTALHNLREAAAAFRGWETDVQQAISDLFDFSLEKDARLHTLSTGLRIRQRQRAAQQVDDFSYLVRTRFPYPIAYRWRVIEVANPDRDYQEVFECAEIVACYLACMAIVAVKEGAKGVHIGKLGDIAKKLKGSQGTTFGDWCAILTEVNEKKELESNSSGAVPFYEVIRLLDKAEVSSALKFLYDTRNDFSHSRRPRGAKLGKKFEECRDALRVLLQGSEFLTEYPFRYVENTRPDIYQQVTKYSYRDLIGDHPLVGITHYGEVKIDKHLEEGSLYLVDRDDEPYLLRPLLTRQECPECDQWSIFYLDRYVEECCDLKSMEHGHTLKDSSLVMAFEKIGLLTTK